MKKKLYKNEEMKSSLHIKEINKNYVYMCMHLYVFVYLVILTINIIVNIVKNIFPSKFCKEYLVMQKR